MEEPEGVVELSLTITRNGWGYTNLAVSTEGEFVFTEIDTVTEADLRETGSGFPYT